MAKKNNNLNVEQSCNENGEKERRYTMAEMIAAGITIVISIVSLVVSIIAVMYADKEYEYKLSPEITTMAKLGVEAYQLDDNINFQFSAKELKIKIINKNNLEKAYLIYPNNTVKKLNVNDIEGSLEEDLNKNIELKEHDLEEGGKFYQYRFLFLMGLDGSYELHLIYTKGEGKDLEFYGLSGIEIWGLENSNKDNPEFEGERIMAEQYRKILEESSNYIK